MAEAPALIGIDTLLALALVLGLLLLLAAGLRWLGPRLAAGPAGGERIELLASRMLDNRSRASLLRCGGRRYLVITTAGGACLLDAYPEGGTGTVGERARAAEG